MISKKLQEARDYEAKRGAEISPQERPLFHVTPTIGWLNDPNGLSYYQGEYHLFYQYHPYNTQWGPMHWGHCKSSDLLHWTRLPAALAPDQPYDIDGCFSGSAAALEDGRHLLLYTGVHQAPQPDGSVQVRQTQCIALGDGCNYEKYPLNPVITAEQLPPGGSPIDFRDPKLWKEGDAWYAVAGNRTPDGSGAVLLFTSPDAVHWRFVRILDRSANQYGKMWECPDFFTLDGHSVMLVSPQDMQARGLDFREGNEVMCLLGSSQPDGAFTRQAVLPVDQGLDFYAPQTLQTADGRRIMIGWLQSWESSQFVPAGQKWFGQLSLPRELHIADGKLLQTPLRELLACRRRPVSYQHVAVADDLSLPGISGRTLDMTIRLELTSDLDEFTLRLAQDDARYTSLTYQAAQQTLTLDRTHSGFSHHAMQQRTIRVAPRQHQLTLRIILDRFSLEAFINEGEQAMSSALYTPQTADRISFSAKGCCCIDVEKYDIEL